MKIHPGDLVYFNYDFKKDSLYSRLPPKRDDPDAPILGIVLKKNGIRSEFVVIWNDAPGKQLSYFEEELVNISLSTSED